MGRHWVIIGDKKELEGKNLKGFSVGSKRVVVVNYEGSYYAFDAECPHMQGPLDEGAVVDGWLECPWHHYLYDIKTGENYYPKNVYPEDLKHTVPPLRSYAVRERNGKLEIEIEDGGAEQ